jgi:hypothetical protein
VTAVNNSRSMSGSYALDTLKADGIGLMTNYGDKWPGDAAYAEVFEELNRRRAVVFFHPAAPNCCKNLVPHVPTAFTEFPHDTTPLQYFFDGWSTVRWTAVNDDVLCPAEASRNWEAEVRARRKRKPRKLKKLYPLGG